MPHDSLQFDPSPDQLPALLSDLMRPDLSLEDIANSRSTVVEALFIWMVRPEVQERLNALNHAAAQRVRLMAVCRLNDAVHALSTMLRAYSCDEHNLNTRPSLETTTLDETRRANARRAANLLLRIARFDPTPGPASTPRSNSLPRSAPPAGSPPAPSGAPSVPIAPSPTRFPDVAPPVSPIQHPAAPRAMPSNHRRAIPFQPPPPAGDILPRDPPGAPDERSRHDPGPRERRDRDDNSG